MIRSLRNEKPAADQAADVCIVGAGAAGIVLAVELARLGKRVLLLEGGGREIEDDAQEPYQSEVTGLPHRGVHVGRFRAHGGTTNKWGGQILELNPEDFDQRPWIVGSGWPFEKKELHPFYDRALVLEGLGEVEHDDTAVWCSLDEQPPHFDCLQPYFTRWTPEPNFARLHSKVLEGDKVDVWLHSNAVRLEMEGDVVRGVVCRTLTSVEHTFRAREFVFCLGAIESSRFFLQPRDGGLPWNADGLVGAHFQDHIDVNVAQLQLTNPDRFHTLFDNVYLHGLKYHPKVRLDPEVQHRRHTLNVAATIQFESEIDETLASIKATAKHLLRGRFGEVGAANAAQLFKHAPLLARQTFRYAMQHRAYNPEDATVWLRAHCEQEPLGASSISLSGERDALGMLRTRLNWQIADSEIDSMRVLVRTAAEAMATFATVVPVPELAADDVFRACCDDSNHHMSGMRMAAPGLPGVVDPDLRLRGTQNCYIGSSAVFPTSGFSNPTHTLLALMVRLADKLAK